MIWCSTGPCGVSRSGHATSCGNTAPMMSSDSRRCIGAGFLRPPLKRNTVRERLRFQRHRTAHIGANIAALRSTSSTVFEERNFGMSSSGNCAADRARAARNRRWRPPGARSRRFAQNRFRSARPSAGSHGRQRAHARRGCMPPLSSRTARGRCARAWAPHRVRSGRPRGSAPPSRQRRCRHQLRLLDHVIARRHHPREQCLRRRCEGLTPRARALSACRCLNRARTEPTAVLHGRPRRARSLPPRAGSSTRCSPAGRCRLPRTRSPSPR